MTCFHWPVSKILSTRKERKKEFLKAYREWYSMNEDTFEDTHPFSVSLHPVQEISRGWACLSYHRLSPLSSNPIKLKNNRILNCHCITGLLAESLHCLSVYSGKLTTHRAREGLYRKFWVEREKPAQIELLCHYWPLNSRGFGLIPTHEHLVYGGVDGRHSISCAS